MRNLSRLLAATACALVAVSHTACVTDAEVADGDDLGGKADGAGTNGSVGFIQSNSPFYWAQSDYASFLSASQQTHTPIADDDALTQRLQYWADKIDTMVRAEMKRSAGIELVAPKPIVKVLASGTTFNAWVSGALSCTGQARPGTTDLTQLSYLGARMVQSGPFACVRPAWPGTTDLVTFWNRAKPACKLGADGSVAGAGCEIDSNAPGELAIYATSPYIHVTSKLLATADELTMAVVMAHELGHYYRSHVTEARVAKYDFWFDNEVDRKKRPVPAANAAELALQYAAIVQGPATIQAAIPGRYSPRLRTFLLATIPDLLTERVEPGFVCAAARDALGPWRDALRNDAGLPTEQINDYLQFETALAACAPRLNLYGDPSATAISYGRVLMSVMDAKLGKVTLPFRATLADVLTALNTNAKKLDAKEAALLAKVKQNRIGLYTTEQEADDLAMEFAARIGISPDQVVQGWLGFMKQIITAVPEEYRPQYEAEYASCKTLLDANFTTTDSSGNKIAAYVPIGDLSEPHHSDCYRLFNFWRNKKLRNYTVASPVVFAPGWDALRTHAQELSDIAGSNGL
jgi:hypothetical protein